MVFQEYSLFPNMTARQNIEFGLRMQKVPESTRRATVNRMIEITRLEEHAAKFPHQMSGGQKQRVALARAIAISPRVLLLDEPLSALDAKVRESLRDEIRRLQIDLGVTTIFVTHDQHEALAIADRVGVMSNGRLEQLAAPARRKSSSWSAMKSPRPFSIMLEITRRTWTRPSWVARSDSRLARALELALGASQTRAVRASDRLTSTEASVALMDSMTLFVSIAFIVTDLPCRSVVSMFFG